MINTEFDFTTELPPFWTDFWKQNDGLGAIWFDPDAHSKTLYEFHQKLWSRKTPSGKQLEFEVMRMRYGSYCLKDKTTGNSFSSDTLVNAFLNYSKNNPQIKKVITEYKSSIGEEPYRREQEAYIRKAYTIGNMIIFPKLASQKSINCQRGNRHRQLYDRIDLTIKCIQDYYNNNKVEDNKLRDVFTKEENKSFLDLFKDFDGFINFFFLQDMIDENGNVKIFLESDYPMTGSDYERWRKCTLEFIANRNNRIKEWCLSPRT